MLIVNEVDEEYPTWISLITFWYVNIYSITLNTLYILVLTSVYNASVYLANNIKHVLSKSLFLQFQSDILLIICSFHILSWALFLLVKTLEVVLIQSLRRSNFPHERWVNDECTLNERWANSESTMSSRKFAFNLMYLKKMVKHWNNMKTKIITMMNKLFT